MAKKSKWLDVNFPPGGFRNYSNATVVTKALPLVEEAAYKSMLKGDPKSLIEAVEGFPFPRDLLFPMGVTHEFNLAARSGRIAELPRDFVLPRNALGITYEFNQAPGLARIAELLWFLHAPSKTGIRTYAKAKKIAAKAAREELCSRAAQALRGSFTHAWRLYDADIHKGMSEAMHGFINEIVVQTIWEVPGALKTQLKREQLYKLAVSDEENARRQRMKFGPGGSESEYNLRWFPAHYSNAYAELSEGAKIYKELQASRDKGKRERWRASIKEKFPDLEDELIARLSRRSLDLTDEHNALLVKKGGDSTPSNIALEQAARWCGIGRYRYTKRALLKRLEPKKSLPRERLLYSFLVKLHSLSEQPNEQNLGALISTLEI